MQYVVSLSNYPGKNRGLNVTGSFTRVFNVRIEDGGRRLKDPGNGVNSKNFVENVLKLNRTFIHRLVNSLELIVRLKFKMHTGCYQ